MLAGTERLPVSSSQERAGWMGFSLEYKTVSLGMPRRFSSRRMTLHRGQTEVFPISVISNSSG